MLKMTLEEALKSLYNLQRRPLATRKFHRDEKGHKYPNRQTRKVKKEKEDERL